MRVRTGKSFSRQFKRLIRKYPSLDDDVEAFVYDLLKAPLSGIPLGKNCYKHRLSLKSKGLGKSGAARLITCVKMIDGVLTLLSIYDKSESDTISKARLDDLLREEGLD
jgi:mRNA-degrading endonuclease RelE of RelBE toxin-antitoxin system